MSFDIPIPPPERIKEDVQHLKEWFSKQPHLPKVEDDDWLETFLYRNKFSLEKTKFKLDHYYSLRTKYPEILKNRDPTSPDVLRSFEAVQLGFSDKLMKGSTRILYSKYGKDARVLDVEHLLKMFFMVLDMMLLNKDNRLARLAIITDFQNITYLHIMKLMTGVPRVAEIFTGAYSERLKSIHLINIPSFAVKFTEYLKKFFPPKIASRFHMHASTGSSLLEILNEDIVCSDFGGSGPSIHELQDLTKKNLEKHRKWFEEQDEVCSNELLRPTIDGQLEEMKGSFRALDID